MKKNKVMSNLSKIAFVLLLAVVSNPLYAETVEQDFNILTINNIPSGRREAGIIVAVVPDAENVRDLNRRQNDRDIVVAVGYRDGNTFRFHELTDGEYDPSRPWRGAGNFFLALSDSEGNEGNQWIVRGSGLGTVLPAKHSFTGNSFELSWNRFMFNPF